MAFETAVTHITITAGAVWSDPQVTSAVHVVQGEGYCLKIFKLLDALVQKVLPDRTKFADHLTDGQLHRTLINASIQT